MRRTTRSVRKSHEEVQRDIYLRKEWGSNTSRDVRFVIYDYKDYQDKCLYVEETEKEAAEKKKNNGGIYPPANSSWTRIEYLEYIAYVNFLLYLADKSAKIQGNETNSKQHVVWKNKSSTLKELVTWSFYRYDHDNELIMFQIGPSRAVGKYIYSYVIRVDLSIWELMKVSYYKDSVDILSKVRVKDRRGHTVSMSDMLNSYFSNRKTVLEYPNEPVRDQGQVIMTIKEAADKDIVQDNIKDQFEDPEINRHDGETDLKTLKQQLQELELYDSDLSDELEDMSTEEVRYRIDTHEDKSQYSKRLYEDHLIIPTENQQKSAFKTANVYKDKPSGDIIDLTKLEDGTEIIITKNNLKEDEPSNVQNEKNEKEVEKQLQLVGKATKRKRDYNTPVVVYDQDDRVYMKTIAGPNQRAGEEKHCKDYVYYGNVSESGTIMYNIMEIPKGRNFYNQRDSDKMFVTGIHFRNIFEQTMGDKVTGRMIIFYSDHNHYDPYGIINKWTKILPEYILEKSITNYDSEVVEGEIPDWDYDPTCLSHYNFQYTMLNEQIIILYDYYQEFNVKAVGEEFLNRNQARTKYVKLDDLQLPFKWDNSQSDTVPVHGCLGVLFIGDFFGGKIACNLNMRIFYETQH